MGNAVVHFEVAAADDRVLVAFYRELFGWRLRGLAGGGYTMIDTCAGEGINGGIARSRNGEPWSAFYVEVEDPQATLDKANSLGGTTVIPVTDVNGTPIAMLEDPDGLRVGLVQGPAEASGVYASAPSDGSGEMLDWFEIMGSDAARTQHFYTELFDWTLDETGFFPGYAIVDTLTTRGIQGGIGGGQESRWATTYAWVADLDEVLGRAEKLGGSPVLDQSIPELKSRARYATVGVRDDMRTGAFRDPAGNVVGVFEFTGEPEPEQE